MSKPLSTESVKCVRVIRDTRPSLYALPDDGRKWQVLQADRRTLAMQLATHADGDGTSITVGTTRLFDTLGWARAKLFRRLDDLKRLGFLINEGKTAEHGTAVRLLDLQAVIKKMAGAEVSDSEPKSPIRASKVSDSSNSTSLIRDPKSRIGDPKSLLGGDTTVLLTDQHKPTTTTDRGGSGLIQKLSTMWLQEKKARAELTKANAKDVVELGMTLGEKRVEQVFAVYLKEPSPFKTETTFPFTRFITGFDGYAAVADELPRRAEEAAGKKINQELTYHHGDRHHRISALPKYPEETFTETLTDEQLELIRRCKADYWLKLTDKEEAALKAVFELLDAWAKKEREAIPEL